MRYTVAVEKTHRQDILSKAKGMIQPLNRERAAAKKARIKLQKLFTDALAAMSAPVIRQINSLRKVDEGEIARILNQLNMGDTTELYGDISDTLSALAADGAVAALIQVGITDDAAMFTLVNEYAIDWANEHAAEMVGKKLINGMLVDNPNTQWSIAESTRAMLRSAVAQALEEGWSNDKLANFIKEGYTFSAERAEAIARTETAFADVAGNVIAYQKSGVVKGKKWITAHDDRVSEMCNANAKDGIIDFDKPFTSGAMWPPQHPNCRCDIVPVLKDVTDNQ